MGINMNITAWNFLWSQICKYSFNKHSNKKTSKNIFRHFQFIKLNIQHIPWQVFLNGPLSQNSIKWKYYTKTNILYYLLTSTGANVFAVFLPYWGWGGKFSLRWNSVTVKHSILSSWNISIRHLWILILWIDERRCWKKHTFLYQHDTLQYLSFH